MRTTGRRRYLFIFSLAVVLGLGVLRLAHANSGYMGSFSSRYPVSSLASNCTVCHTSIPSLNTYGSDFKKNKLNLGTIESLDSDGDSFSNLTEINAGTYPGDATSHPTTPPPPALDTTPPNVTSFSIPSSSSTLTVSISAFSATDNVGVTGYIVKESATPPAPGDPGWNALPPSTCTFTSTGEKTLYAWAKDAAGNVSSSLSATVSISAPVEGQGPDLTIWVGKWLKVSEKNTGYQFVPSLFSKDDSVYTGYLRFWEWDPANKLLKGDRYERDSQSGQWFMEPFSLRYVTGSDTDFLCWFQSNGSLVMGFVARIQGKKKEGILESGSMKTLGGYYMETGSGANSTNDSAANGQQYWAGGLSITGTLVPESKVPVPREALIH